MPDGSNAPEVRIADIWQSVPLPDPQGRNPKDRPFVVVGLRDGVARCVAITGTIVPGESESYYVALPWASDGRSRTGLRKQCWAHLGWVRLLDASQLDRKRGHCPPDAAAAIDAGLAAIDGSEPAGDDSPD